MKTLWKALPGLVFVLFLAVMALGLLFLPTREYSENEKRYLEKPPELNFGEIMEGKTQEKLEKYTADQIPGRDLFVGINACWNLATGRNAAQDIYLCREDYLINAPKQGKGEIYQSNLTRFDAFAQSTGLPADLVIVPSTGYLMEPVLPAFHGRYEDDALFAQAQESLQHIRLLDLRESLKAAAAQRQVCYRTDHHLTAFGNYLIYQAYQQALGQPVTPQTEYTMEVHGGFYGTTWSGSGLWFTPPDNVELWCRDFPVTVQFDDGAEQTTEDRLFYRENLEGLDKYPVFLDGNHSLVTIQNPQAQGGSLLLIRDSYGHCLAPFLAEHYQTIYLVDLRYYRSALSAFLAEHPVDRILYLYGIDNLLTDTNSAWLQ